MYVPLSWLVRTVVLYRIFHTTADQSTNLSYVIYFIVSSDLI